MNQWWRSWHGAPIDGKWRTVARRAGVRPGDVAAVVWLLYDRASQAEDRGSIVGYDVEVIADALGYPEEEVAAIIEALSQKGIIEGGRISSWEKYQPKREREDTNSTERVREHRATKRQAEQGGPQGTPAPHEGGDETPPSANCGHETPCNATKRLDTDTEEIREETEKKEGSLRSPDARADARVAAAGFGLFWDVYPHKVGKRDAEKAFNAALRRARLPDIIDGVERYVRFKPPDRSWCNPATFLNQDRYLDQPAEVSKIIGSQNVSQSTPTIDAAKRLRDFAKGEAEAGFFDYGPGDAETVGYPSALPN